MNKEQDTEKTARRLKTIIWICSLIEIAVMGYSSLPEHPARFLAVSGVVAAILILIELVDRI